MLKVNQFIGKLNSFNLIYLFFFIFKVTFFNLATAKDRNINIDTIKINKSINNNIEQYNVVFKNNTIRKILLEKKDNEIIITSYNFYEGLMSEESQVIKSIVKFKKSINNVNFDFPFLVGMQHTYILGLKSINTYDSYGDIILLDFLNNYYNLLLDIETQIDSVFTLHDSVLEYNFTQNLRLINQKSANISGTFLTSLENYSIDTALLYEVEIHEKSNKLYFKTYKKASNLIDYDIVFYKKKKKVRLLIDINNIDILGDNKSKEIISIYRKNNLIVKKTNLNINQYYFFEYK